MIALSLKHQTTVEDGQLRSSTVTTDMVALIRILHMHYINIDYNILIFYI